MQGLAGMPFPLEWKPDHGAAESYGRIREQARVQVEAREAHEVKFELLQVENGFGLTRLPEPSNGDVFFDLESDPFVGEHGLEYLFGHLYIDETGHYVYRSEWAFARTEERQAFEGFVDFVMARWAQFPNMYIYHYAPYETSALKRLMGRYATREEEIDQMLRAGLFVDLYQVVRRGLRASVESYSLKQLEPLYSFKRETLLTDANAALANLQANLELNDIPSITEGIKATVVAYNNDDCRSTAGLRDWLETLRAQLVADGVDVPRSKSSAGSTSENVSDWRILINALLEQLSVDVPADPEERDKQQQARWILANILDWHRREENQCGGSTSGWLISRTRT